MSAADGPVRLYNLDDVPVLNPRVGVVERMFRGNGVSVSFAELHPNMKASPESHPWEQLLVLLDGRVTLHVGEQSFDMTKGHFVRIPPNVVHYCDPPRPEDGVARRLDIVAPVQAIDAELDLIDHSLMPNQKP